MLMNIWQIVGLYAVFAFKSSPFKRQLDKLKKSKINIGKNEEEIKVGVVKFVEVIEHLKKLSQLN